MREKSLEVYKLIDQVISQKNVSFFTYKNLQTYANLTLSEIRTIVSILCEYNVIYPKKKIGLFKNHVISDIIFSGDFELEERDNNLIFKSKRWSVEFDKFEFNLLETLPEFDTWTSARLYTIIVMAAFQLNFYYEKKIIGLPNGGARITRRARHCSDDKLIFTSIVEDDELLIYR